MPNPRGASPLMDIIYGSITKKQDRSFAIYQNVTQQLGELTLAKKQKKIAAAEKEKQEIRDMIAKQSATHQPFAPGMELAGVETITPENRTPLTSREAETRALAGKPIDWKERTAPEGTYPEYKYSKEGPEVTFKSKEALASRGAGSVPVTIDAAGNITIPPGTYKAGSGTTGILQAPQNQKMRQQSMKIMADRLDLAAKSANASIYKNAESAVLKEYFNVPPQEDDIDNYLDFKNKVYQKFESMGGSLTPGMKKEEEADTAFKADLDAATSMLQEIKKSALKGTEKKQRIATLKQRLYQAYPNKKDAIDSNIEE